MNKPASTSTGQLSEYCASLRYQDLPARIVAAARISILDLLGVALVGSREDSVHMLLKAVIGADSRGPASVLGTRATTAPATAALINGHAAHALDYDDFQHKIGTHISAAVVPAMLAMAETTHCSGRDFIAAYVAGFELGCRLGRVANFAHHLNKCGIHSTGYLGHFGAAAAAGRIAQLDGAQMNRCIGISATHASGIARSIGTMCKAQNAANAAHNGVLAAVLAKEGFTGPKDIFDSEQNIFSPFGARSDPAALVDGLGQRFELSDNTPKVYACSGWRSPIVQACIHIAATQNVDVKQVAHVGLVACKDVLRFANYPDPKTSAEAKFSTEYAAAVALADKAGGVDQFGEGRVTDPALRELERKVTFDTSDELKPHQMRVTVVTTDGRTLEHFIAAQKGDPKNPVTDDELIAKFRANALAVLPQSSVDELAERVLKLESVQDTAQIVALCRSA